MMNFRHWVVTGATVLLSASLWNSCKDEEKTCVQGAQQTCSCADGTTGVRVCTSDGSYDACRCGGDADAGGGDADAACADDVDDFDSCMDCLCADEQADCNDNADCVSLTTCVNECGDDEACNTDCSNEYSAGVDDLVAVLDCRDDSCAEYTGADPGPGDTDTSDTDSGDDIECADTVVDEGTCMDCYCQDPINECISDDDCGGLISCFAGCADDDVDCINTCYTDYSAGEDLYDAIYACDADYCLEYLNDPTECADTVADIDTCENCYCYGYVIACVTNDACLDFYDCLAACDSDACTEACMSDYPDGVDDFIDYYTCMDESCSDYAE